MITIRLSGEYAPRKYVTVVVSDENQVLADKFIYAKYGLGKKLKLKIARPHTDYPSLVVSGEWWIGNHERNRFRSETVVGGWDGKAVMLIFDQLETFSNEI